MTHRLSLGCLLLGMLCLAACSSKQPAGGAAQQSAKVGKTPAAVPQAAGSAAKKPGTDAAKESKTTVVFRDEPAAHALAIRGGGAACLNSYVLLFVSFFFKEFWRFRQKQIQIKF